MYNNGGAFQYPGGPQPTPQQPQQTGPTLTPGLPGWDPRTSHPLPPPGQPQQQPQQPQAQSGVPQVGAPLQQGPSIPPWARLPHPKYVSLTCSAMPNSNAVRTRANVPLGVILRPLADPPSSASAQPLPIINPTATGVIRCKACRAYINPFVQFLGGGSQWRCNICHDVNDVPQAYFSSLDATGRRHDLEQRPELVHGSLEIVAPVDYMVRQPMPPVYFFLIDVSEASIRSGMLQTLCDTILSILDRLPGDKRTLVGFITFDSTVHFYSLKAGSTTTPQMFVMSDLDDIFLPQPQDLLVNLDESRSQVEQLLQSLPSMHVHTKDVESAFGPALEGALQVQSRIGGKLLIFLSGLPSLGEGRLINRENTRQLGTDKEHLLLSTPSVEFYQKHAVKLTKFQICAELFLFHNDLNANSSFLDLATLSSLNKLTGGQLYYYPNYTSQHHGSKFTKELSRCLIRSQGWEAVVRVRVSKGLRITEYHGNFFMRGADLLALPGVDSDKAFAFELKNDESLLTQATVSIQAALLYTTSSGERRIRVHTTCIPVTQSIGELFERVNVNAITNLLAKQAIIGVYKEGFEKAREFIRNRCVALLRTHRGALAKQQASPSTELNVLPLMTLGLLKNGAFKEGAELRTDARAYLLASMYTMGIVEMETFVRPRMLPVHDMQDGVGLAKERAIAPPPPAASADGQPPPPPVQTIELPAEAGLTADVLKTDTVFLVDNGMEFLLRVGRGVSSEWTMSVFGVPSLEGIDTRTLNLLTPHAQDTNSPLRRLTNILTYLREVSPLYQQLYIMKEGEASELRFFNMLIEDRNMRSLTHAHTHTSAHESLIVHTEC